MVTTILSLVLALFKALPEVVSLVKELKQSHDAQLNANQNANAIQRFQTKKAASADAIANAVATVRTRVQNDTATFTKVSDISKQ